MTLKRVFDIFVVMLTAPLTIPLAAILAILVTVNLGWPCFFTQVRPGLRAKPFRLVKFRTMTNARDAAGQLLDDAYRLTTFGKFLRSTSLDELPELWNVFKGDMSLVGPRPLLMEYLPLYTPEQSRRHDVKPGMTGWAQINGRNALGWQERFALDVWYVDNRSLLLDIKILLRTVTHVAARKGISHANAVTMPRFTNAHKEAE